MILRPLSLSSSIPASPASLVAMAVMGVLVSLVVRAALEMVDRAMVDQVTAALAMVVL
ncbi:hypothetical protein EC988_008143, partial [Linderina pennispora]